MYYWKRLVTEDKIIYHFTDKEDDHHGCLSQLSEIPSFILENEVQWYPSDLPSSSKLAELLHNYMQTGGCSRASTYEAYSICALLQSEDYPELPLLPGSIIKSALKCLNSYPPADYMSVILSKIKPVLISLDRTLLPFFRVKNEHFNP
jgi:hypothetical protein